MNDPVASLVLDLLEWIGLGSRPYRQVMDAWRTSCPRLPVWETANELGYVTHRHVPGNQAEILLSPLGREFILSRRPQLRQVQAMATTDGARRCEARA